MLSLLLALSAAAVAAPYVPTPLEALTPRVGQMMELGSDPSRVCREIKAEALKNVGRVHVNSPLKRVYEGGIESLTGNGELAAMLHDESQALAAAERAALELRTRIAMEKQRDTLHSSVQLGVAPDPVAGLRAELQQAEANVRRLKVRKLAIESLLLEAGAADVKFGALRVRLERGADYKGWRLAK